MSFIKMRFICDQIPNNLTLHCLYTSIRYLVKKKDNNNDELFQVWNDGRTIFIVIDEDHIENNDSNFVYNHDNNLKINIKLVKKEPLVLEDFEEGEYVYVKGVFSYAYKHYDKINKNKYKLSCPVNIKGKFKNGLKKPMFEYLETITGLLFIEEQDNDTIRFERIFMDECILYNSLNNHKSISSKILFKNVISIDAVVRIGDKQAFDNLLKGSIGKKKNYGLGKLFVEKV